MRSQWDYRNKRLCFRYLPVAGLHMDYTDSMWRQPLG